MDHTKLPEWHGEYLEHFRYYNEGFIGEREEMIIQFIPRNNKLTMGDYRLIMAKLQELISLSRGQWCIDELNRPEGGFQLSYKNYELKHSYDMQIRFNASNFPKEQVSGGFELRPFESVHRGTGINIFQLCGNHNVPRKLMLRLCRYLEENNMLIFRLTGFPHEEDTICWNTQSIYVDDHLGRPGL